MIIQPDKLKDKVEMFEASSLQELEHRISKKIDDNQAILLEVHHVSHQLTIDPNTSKRFYTATVHFKQK
ncbi:DUF2536 family protein [Salipaludibacillus daqingensis]|uniref:DUF2536 family protein n=1 Tax=Salipaludibacillus daqingensis TaxID=3041001 RepID=UPI0024763518|nr:DUF2536 family protein [Salipaludibacillus daqingensis]